MKALQAIINSEDYNPQELELMQERANALGRSGIQLQQAIEQFNMATNTAQKNEHCKVVARRLQSLEKINTAIQSVDEIINDISAASQDQAKGIQEVNVGLGQIDQGIQLSTATAEESPSISEELASHSRKLREFMNQFTLTDSIKRLQ